MKRAIAVLLVLVSLAGSAQAYWYLPSIFKPTPTIKPV